MSDANLIVLRPGDTVPKNANGSLTFRIEMGVAVSVVFGPGERIPTGDELRQILVENFRTHPGTQSPEAEKNIRFRLIASNLE